MYILFKIPSGFWGLARRRLPSVVRVAGARFLAYKTFGLLGGVAAVARKSRPSAEGGAAWRRRTANPTPTPSSPARALRAGRLPGVRPAPPPPPAPQLQPAPAPKASRRQGPSCPCRWAMTAGNKPVPDSTGQYRSRDVHGSADPPCPPRLRDPWWPGGASSNWSSRRPPGATAHSAPASTRCRSVGEPYAAPGQPNRADATAVTAVTATCTQWELPFDPYQGTGRASPAVTRCRGRRPPSPAPPLPRRPPPAAAATARLSRRTTAPAPLLNLHETTETHPEERHDHARLHPYGLTVEDITACSARSPLNCAARCPPPAARRHRPPQWHGGAIGARVPSSPPSRRRDRPRHQQAADQ